MSAGAAMEARWRQAQAAHVLEAAEPLRAHGRREVVQKGQRRGRAVQAQSEESLLLVAQAFEPGGGEGGEGARCVLAERGTDGISRHTLPSATGAGVTYA